MPLVQLSTTATLTPAKKAALVADLSRACAVGTGKPETYVMVSLQEGLTMSLAGSTEPAAFIDVRAIGGLTPAMNQALSATLCQVVSAATGVPPMRIYLNFTSLAGSHWGHDGATFG